MYCTHLSIHYKSSFAEVILGTLLICCGSILMIYDKILQEESQQQLNITFQ